MGHVVRMGGMINAWNNLTQDPQVEKQFDVQRCICEVRKCKQERQCTCNTA
jgi:hypothetical protein